MDEEAAFRNLFAYLRRTAGDSLRTVARYDAEGHQVLYGADALSAYSEEERVALVGSFREERGAESERERASDLGALRSTVRLFDDAVVLHLFGDDVGAIVSLYPEAASALSTFVAGCRERLASCPGFESDRAGPPGEE